MLEIAKLSLKSGPSLSLGFGWFDCLIKLCGNLPGHRNRIVLGNNENDRLEAVPCSRYGKADSHLIGVGFEVDRPVLVVTRERDRLIEQFAHNAMSRLLTQPVVLQPPDRPRMNR